MGFLFLFNGIILIVIIVVMIINRHEGGVFVLLYIPILTFLLTAAIIAGVSSRNFKNEQLTTIDKIVDVVVVKDMNGIDQYAFPYFDEDLALVSGFSFDETIIGDKMQVHLIKRETYKTFFTFGSSSKKTILIIPESKKE